MGKRIRTRKNDECRSCLASKNYTISCVIKMLEIQHFKTNFKLKFWEIIKSQALKKFE